MNSRVKPGYLRTRAEVRERLARAKASRCAGPQTLLESVILDKILTVEFYQGARLFQRNRLYNGVHN